MTRPLTIPLDTTLEAARVQRDVLMAMGPERRLEVAAQLSDSVRACVVAGVRMRCPDYDEEQVRRAVLRIVLGEPLFRKLFPQTNVRP
jgi:hypothetical protein